MLNHINLADVRTFVLIARLGNFTKAADALSVSRSHVSRQIRSLEARMGVTLLIRTTRTLRLTQAGEQFYVQCEKALQEIEQAVVAAVDDTEVIKGLIRVNCVGGYLGEELIARYVADFMVLHPQVDIELDFSSHRIDLIDEHFDIAFRMGDLENAGFIARYLMPIDIVTLASPAYIKRCGEPQHPSQLIEHRCLTGTVKRWAYQSVLDHAQHCEVNVSGALVCRNGRALVAGALAGTGIIRVPQVYCQNEIESGQLVEVMPEWHIPSVAFSAIFHRDKYQPKRLRTFIDYIKQQFESEHSRRAR